MIANHYEINVSKDGKHFFATHKRSIPDEAKLKKILLDFVKKFPESEGYEISVTSQFRYGRHISIEGVLKK